MGFREWNDRVNERWSQNMDYMEASFKTPPSCLPDFMRSSKAPDTRAAFYSTGFATGLLIMAAQAALYRGSIGWSLALTALSIGPAAYHTWRGKKILSAQPQAPQVS